MCWLCCSLWLIIVTDRYLYSNNLYTHVLEQLSVPYSRIKQSAKCRYLSINSALHARRVRISFTIQQNHESLLLLSFSSTGIYMATRKSKGFFSQGCREG